MKKTSKALSVIFSLILVVSLFSLTASAETSVNGSTVTVDKYLVLDSNVNVPESTFTFTLAAGDAVDATANTSAIVAGTMTGAKLVYGEDSTDATIEVGFDGEDTTFAEPQGSDTVDLVTGQKYVVKSFNVDLTGVVFTEPGVYRYVITETGTNIGVTNDDPGVRYLDIYVDSDGEALSISGAVLHKTDDVAANEDGATYEPENKDEGFTNTYETADLTISKDITGNQGFRNKYFPFTVNIANAQAGTILNVDLNDAEATVGENTNPATITVGEDGTATATFYLKDDQSVIIRGLTSESTYTVSEDAEDYTPSYVIDEEDSADGDSTGDAKTMGADDHTVVFTNDRSGIVPTGIIVEFAPYIVIALIAIAGAIVLMVRKKKALAK